MLQDIRQNIQGTAAKIVVGLIVVSFSIFGIESILVGGSGSGVAEVNGEEITPQELQQAVNTQKRRLIAMMGDNLDPAMLDDQRLSAQAMDGLVNRKLLTQSAGDMKLAISERQIGQLIGSMEQFQIEGKFSAEVYKSVLSSAGYTPAYFKQSLREDVMLNQLRSGLAGSEFTTPSELELNARIAAEQRDLRYLTIPLEKFNISADIREEEVEAYYTANQTDFRTTESVDLEYIELRADDFRQPVEEREILEAYQLQKENFQYQTENRVSHILFESDSDDAESVLQQRIAEAQARLASGADFAEVAEEFSDDIGSAGNGGDLGYSRGDAFPEEMEQAITALQTGVVSAPVQTDAGTHLIVVTERAEGTMPELEEVRMQIEDTLQLEAARLALLRTVETLRDLSFNAEDLEGPATELELSVNQVPAVTRSQSDGLFANPSLLAAAFSEEVLEARHNSEVIELSGDSFVVLRVSKHNKPEVMPLASVREDIVAIMADNAARDAIAAEAESAVLALRSGTGLEQLATERGYEWQVELGADRGNANVPTAILRRAFEMPVPDGSETSVEYVMSPTGDAQVFQLVRVTAGQLEALADAEQQMLQRRVSAEYGSLLDVEYQRGLRDSADITVL